MGFIFDPSLVLYLPLYELDGSSFMSRDAYGHLATVVGATWTPRGRIFDGSDDKLDITSSLLSGTKDTDQKTIGFWVSTPNTTGHGNIVCVRDAGGNNWQLYRKSATYDLYIHSDDINQDTGYDYPQNRFVQITAIIDGIADQWQIYVNGLWEYTYQGANFAADNGGNAFRLGSDSSGYLNGTCGEAWIYNRRLTPAEIQHNFLVTKWRYR